MTTGDEKQDGTVATLRGVAVIVLAGVALGLAFNALGLASKPPRGLPWIRQAEKKMPSLEDLQPGSRLVPEPAPRPFAASAFALVGTAWAGGSGTTVVASDTARVAVKKPGVRKASAKKAVKKPVTKPPAVAAKPVPMTASPVATPPAAAVAPAPAKAALPVVPDLDQPIEVKLAFAKRFFDAGPGAAVFIDAREAAQYAESHIAGALSVPFDDAVKDPALLAPFQRAGRPLILYCDGGDCELSKDLAKNMLADGIRKVLVFTDGLPAWKAAGYPVETGVAKAAR